MIKDFKAPFFFIMKSTISPQTFIKKVNSRFSSCLLQTRLNNIQCNSLWTSARSSLCQYSSKDKHNDACSERTNLRKASFELINLFIPINSWDALFCAHLMTNCSLQSNTGQWICQLCQQSRAQLLTRFSEVSLMWLLLKMPKLNIIVSNNTVLYTRAMLEFQVVNKQQTAFQFKVNINLIYLNLYRRRRSFVVCGPRA